VTENKIVIKITKGEQKENQKDSASSLVNFAGCRLAAMVHSVLIAGVFF
jgi:hypothetical protein